MSDAPFLLRQGTSSDLPYVLDTWVKAYGGSPFARHIARAGLNYARIQDAIAKACLYTSEPHGLRIAAAQDFPDVVVGWACMSNVLHYVWVDRQWRRQGIARALTGGVMNGIYTHAPPPDVKPFFEGWTYEPKRIEDLIIDVFKEFNRGPN